MFGNTVTNRDTVTRVRTANRSRKNQSIGWFGCVWISIGGYPRIRWLLPRCEYFRSSDRLVELLTVPFRNKPDNGWAIGGGIWQYRRSFYP